MTSVSFPFLVGTPGPDKQIPLLDAEFRFTVSATRKLERACGGNLDWVVARGQAVDAVVLLVCYGLVWNDKKMTEEKAEHLVEDFIDAGGDVIELTKALYTGLAESGVYGRKKDDEAADPLVTATASPSA